MEKLFYELIQVSTGQVDCLSRGPEPEEWQELYEMARQQHLVGICYRGVQLLFEFGLRAPQDLAIDWMSEAEMIEERSGLLAKRWAKVQQRLMRRSYRASMLAGPGTISDYGETLQSLRQLDGIDVLVNVSLEDLQSFVKRVGQEKVEHDSQQVFLRIWEGTEVRLHYQLDMGKNPMKNRAIHQWYEHNRRLFFIQEGEGYRLSPEGDVIYHLVHLYWRFMYKGISLRDLLDCFFAFKRTVGQSSEIDYEKILKSFGMLHFSQGVMWIMHEVFGLEKETKIIAPLETKGAIILKEVMNGKHHFFRLFLKYPIEMLLSLL
ncbi:MAG: nucleotidyltransferase family protein [Prevotella sp.]|nr:nucleotidyltransferase family protein [Prevotella sp.]